MAIIDVGFITLATASFFFPVAFKARALEFEDALTGAFAMELVMGRSRCWNHNRHPVAKSLGHHSIRIVINIEK